MTHSSPARVVLHTAGDNEFGQLGSGSEGPWSSSSCVPRLVDALEQRVITAVSAGAHHTGAVTGR